MMENPLKDRRRLLKRVFKCLSDPYSVFDMGSLAELEMRARERLRREQDALLRDAQQDELRRVGVKSL